MKLYGVTGWKNSGKTTLVERLVAHFTAAGLSVATIKRAHHDARTDIPGSDSDRHRIAGARQVLLVAPERWALLTEAPEPPLEALLARLDPADLVLIEGYKAAPHPKIECHRAVSARAPLIATHNPTIRAIASDAVITVEPVNLPVLALDDITAIAGFIAADLGLAA